MLLDQLFSLFRLHVTDHHHGHQVGPVPILVETLDGFRLEGFQDGFLADRHAFRIARTVQQLGIQDLVHAVAGALAQARLFQHDAALAVDVGRIEFQAMRPVFQHEEALFQVFLLVRRNRQHVHGFIETRVGVQVGAELHADRLQIRNQLIALEMRGAIEGHVFGEMRQALLVVIFEDGAGFHHQAQLHFLGRTGIFLDVVGQAIRQFPDGHFWCQWQGVAQTDFRLGHAGARQQDGARDQA